MIRATACLPRRGRGGALEIPVNAENRGKVDIEAWDDGSGRLARRMTARGAPAADVMGQDCWASPAMIARYTRGETAGRAARYLA